MDKRQYYRFNLNLEVRHRILESLKAYQDTLTEDMCEKGIKINLSESIVPDTRLELIIKIPEEPFPIMAIGRVAWVKKDSSGRFWTAGIRILYIREEDKQKFYQKAFS